MKHLLIILFASLLIIIPSSIFAQSPNHTYKIRRFGSGSNTDSVMINDVWKKINDSFCGNVTDWGKVEVFFADDLTNGRPEVKFSKKEMASRNGGSSILGWFRNFLGQYRAKDGSTYGNERTDSIMIVPQFDFNNSKRIALIIYNDNYVVLDADSLNNDNLVYPELSAHIVESELNSLGWGTFVLGNCTSKELKVVLDEFKNYYKDDETIEAILFYYVGHGGSSSKTDYVMFPYSESFDLMPSYTSVPNIIEELQNSIGVSLFFFDCCRDYNNTLLDGKSIKDVLKPNTIVLQSTENGKKVGDRTTFAESVFKHIKREKVFMELLNDISNTLRDKEQGKEFPRELILEVSNKRVGPLLASFSFYNGEQPLDTIKYWGIEASVSSPLSLSVGIGGHYGIYLGKEGFWKNVFSEFGTTFCYLNSDKIHLYDYPNALVSSESYKYHFRWDLFARIGYSHSNFWLVPYFELSEQNYFSKHTANALALSGNLRIKLPLWNTYIAGGGGFATGLGKNLGLVWHKAPLKNLYWNVQIGINFHK